MMGNPPLDRAIHLTRAKVPLHTHIAKDSFSEFMSKGTAPVHVSLQRARFKAGQSGVTSTRRRVTSVSGQVIGGDLTIWVAIESMAHQAVAPPPELEELEVAWAVDTRPGDGKPPNGLFSG